MEENNDEDPGQNEDIDQDQQSSRAREPSTAGTPSPADLSVDPDPDSVSNSAPAPAAPVVVEDEEEVEVEVDVEDEEEQDDLEEEEDDQDEDNFDIGDEEEVEEELYEDAQGEEEEAEAEAEVNEGGGDDVVSTSVELNYDVLSERSKKVRIQPSRKKQFEKNFASTKPPSMVSPNPEAVVNVNANNDANADDLEEAAAEWLTPGMDLGARLRYAYENGFHTDMEFIYNSLGAGEGQPEAWSVPGHTFIVQLWQEGYTGGDVTGEGSIVTKDQLETFVKYLYTEKVDDLDDYWDIITLAGELRFPLVYGNCCDQLGRSINIVTVCKILSGARENAIPEMEENSLAFILQSPGEVVNSATFVTLNRDSLAFLLERDDLAVDEIDLYKAVVRWAEFRLPEIDQVEDGKKRIQALRNVLDGVEFLIRLPLIAIAEYNEFVLPQKLFEKDYLKAIVNRKGRSLDDPVAEGVTYEMLCRRRKTPMTNNVVSMSSVYNYQGQGQQCDLVDEGFLSRKLKQFCETEKGCDLVFKVGEGEDLREVKTSRLILALWSPIFDLNFLTWPGPENQVIEIPNGDETVTRLVVKMMMTLKPEDIDAMMNYGCSLNLLLQATAFVQKAQIGFLEQKITAAIRRRISRETALGVFHVVRRNPTSALYLCVKRYILANANVILNHSDFAYLERDEVWELLKDDDLNIGEVQLFRIVRNWAEDRLMRKGLEVTGENLREELSSELICLIRFPLMTKDEFEKVVEPAGVINKQERTEILMYFGAKSKSEIATKSGMFNSKRRNLFAAVRTWRKD